MNRRDLLKNMLAVPSVARIEEIEPKPGEVFIIETTGHMSQSDINDIVQTWHKAFEYYGLKTPPVLVFPSGWSLKVAKLP